MTTLITAAKETMHYQVPRHKIYQQICNLELVSGPFLGLLVNTLAKSNETRDMRSPAMI